MAADHTVADRLRRGGLRPMAPERALAALGAALGHGDVTVAVADLDWSHFAPAHCKDRPGRLLDTLPEAGARSKGQAANRPPTGRPTPRRCAPSWPACRRPTNSGC